MPQWLAGVNRGTLVALKLTDPQEITLDVCANTRRDAVGDAHVCTAVSNIAGVGCGRNLSSWFLALALNHNFGILGVKPKFPIAGTHNFGSLRVKPKKSTRRWRAGVDRGKIPSSRRGSRMSSSASEFTTV
ncbi:hypothetical protein BPOR_0274g00050 [Botrytis porri]|uniref:Uncharacterized protein n=1 Tax=Botrytis porri TaxID=87229 RepID=A0A4Z1KRA0_9HELO|nr:hypothetical protein BPOR_0274g00050 [Botrytis porri]